MKYRRLCVYVCIVIPIEYIYYKHAFIRFEFYLILFRSGLIGLNSYKMAEHIELGKQGEELAVSFLLEKGFVILHRNWRCRHEELDIVARDGIFLVFVEVKTRRNIYHGMPEEAVSLTKQRLLVNAADTYITHFNLDLEARFDIIAIHFRDEIPIIRHFPEAFSPFD